MTTVFIWIVRYWRELAIGAYIAWLKGDIEDLTADLERATARYMTAETANAETNRTMQRLIADRAELESTYELALRQEAAAHQKTRELLAAVEKRAQSVVNDCRGVAPLRPKEQTETCRVISTDAGDPILQGLKEIQ